MWRQINFKNVKIEKLVGEFGFWVDINYPFNRMTIRIYENAEGEFRGCTSLAFKFTDTGKFENNLGNGTSLEETLNNVIMKFDSLVKEVSPDNLECKPVDWHIF